MGMLKGTHDGTDVFTVYDNTRWLRINRKGTAPSGLMLEAGDGVNWWIWIDNSDNIRMDTSKPTSSTIGTAGSVVTGASNAGASKNLSNLATTTAISESLVSDTDSTDDLGSSSIYWANAYVDKLYLHATNCSLTGAANKATLLGGLDIGSSGAATNKDVKIFLHTANKFMVFDESADDIIIADATGLIFGGDESTADGVKMEFDGTSTFAIDAITANDDIIIGASTATDVEFHGTTATSDMGWTSATDTLQICDDAILHIGGTGLGTVTDGARMFFNASAGSLDIDVITAHDPITFGSNVVTDLSIHGNAYDILWDASEDELKFGDNVEVIWGAGKDLQIESDGTDVHFTFAATTNGIVIQPYAAATVAAVHIDGATNDWDGATGVGMLHISSDTALAHAAASNLLVTHATAAPITDADGFLARFVSTGTARTNAYALDVVVTTTQPAMRLNSTVEITGVDTTANILKLTGVDTTNNTDTVLIDHSGDGYAINIDLNEATSDGINVEAYTNHTVPLIRLDGDTAGFLGASNIGMLTIQNDIALTHVNSSALVIDVGTTKPKDSAEGYCFRIIDTSLVATTPPAYAAYIDTTANEGLAIETRAAAAKNLILMGAAGQTDSMLHVDGGTGAGWDGADGVGMVQLNGHGAHAHANASLLNIVDDTGASIASGRGTSLRIVDTTTVGADSWVAYIDTTANDGLLINTGHANCINLKLTGIQAQVAPMMLIDASTGTGWDGADDVGALEITSDSTLVANGATLLRVESSAQQKSGAEGALARFENTGTAQADAVMVEIIAKDHDEYALNVGTGMVKITDWVTAGGYHHNVTDVTATDAGLQLTDKYGFYTYDETTGDNGDILLLPPAVVGMEMWLMNIDAAHDVVLTPYGTEQINALGAGVGTTVGEGVLTHLICSVTGHWRGNNYAAAGTITACA